MKQLKKIFVSVLAQFCVCVCLSLTVEAFDGDEYVSTPLEELNFIEESGTWMNPLYEDLKIEMETENARTASYSVDSAVIICLLKKHWSILKMELKIDLRILHLFDFMSMNV